MEKIHEDPECFGVITDTTGENLVIVTKENVIKTDLITGKITEKENRTHEKYYSIRGKIYGKSGSHLYWDNQQLRMKNIKTENNQAEDRISTTEQHIYVYRTLKVPKEEKKEKENLKILEIDRYSRIGEEQVSFRLKVPHESYIHENTLYTYERGIIYTRKLDITIDTTMCVGSVARGGNTRGGNTQGGNTRGDNTQGVITQGSNRTHSPITQGSIIQYAITNPSNTNPSTTNPSTTNPPNPNSLITYDLDVAIGIVEGRTDGSPSQPKQLVEVRGPPTAICETENYVVLGLRTGAIVFIRKANRETTHTLWHSSQVTHLVHLDQDTVISASKKGTVLLTDGASVSNTFLFSLNQQIKEMHISENGYICIVTPVMLQVYDIPARSLEHTLLFFSRVTQSIPITPVKQVSVPEYLPDLRAPREEVLAKYQVQNAPEKILDGEMHVLGNLLVFTDAKNQIYWIHKELAQIQRASYSNGHIMLCVSETEEKSIASENTKPQKPAGSLNPDQDTIYKLYSISDNSKSGNERSAITLISSTTQGVNYRGLEMSGRVRED